MNSYHDIQSHFESTELYALTSSIDVYHADSCLISDPEMIYEWMIDLADEMNFMTVGDLITNGNWIMQVVEGGVIAACIDVVNCALYIDILATTAYDPYNAGLLTVDYFDASGYSITLTPRI